MDHSRAVTEHFLRAENTIEDSYWDDVFRETSYYQNYDEPVDSPSHKGREVGEFDVLYVNWDDQLALYKEIKTSRGDMYKAERQIKRAEQFFEESEWKVIGTTVLED